MRPQREGHLIDRALARAAERLEIHEPMHQRAHRPEVTSDPGRRKGLRVPFTLVTQRIETRGDHQRGRQTGQIRRPSRRDAGSVTSTPEPPT